MLESFILAGVPVLSRPMGSLKSYSLFDRGIALLSPTLPPKEFSSPVNITPFKKVPVVRIIFLALIVLL